MDSVKPKANTVPFAYSKEGRAFFQAILAKLMEELSRLRKEYLPAENIQVFHHGQSWESSQERETGSVRQTGEFKLHSQMVTFSRDSVLNQELEAITKFVQTMASQMNEAFVQTLYATMSEVCEESNRIIAHPKETSFVDTALAALSTIQCSVDRDGKVSMPTMHLPRELIDKIGMSLLVRGPELRRKFEELRKRLTEEALEREEKRKARFLRE